MYWGNFVVSPYMKDDLYAELSKQRRDDERIIYKVYLGIKSPGSNAGQIISPPYDLLEKPEDICLQVRAANILGSSVTFNEIVVPGKSIEAAFRKAGIAGKVGE